MRVLVCFIAMLFTVSVHAQQPSDEMKKDLGTLLDLTGALKIGEQMGSMISQQILTAMNSQGRTAPPEVSQLIIDVVREHISDFVGSDSSEAGLVAIYAKYYTHDDVKELLKFYQSPLGEKMLEVGPQIALESAQFGQAEFVKRVPQIQKDIQERLQAAGLTQPQPEAAPE